MTFVEPTSASGSRPQRVRLLALLAAVAASFAAWMFLSTQESDLPDRLRVPGAAALASREQRPGREAPLPSGVVVDPDMLWRNRPGISATVPVIPSLPGPAPMWSFRVNNEAFRGADRVAASAGEEIYRIVCVGDSVTFGFNVNQGSDYPSMLWRLLAARYPFRRFEVINAGVPEWSWVQGAAFLLHGGFALRPDVVIAAHGTADQARATVTDSERIWLREQLPQERATARWWNRWNALPAPGIQSGESPGCRLQEAEGSPCRRVSPIEIGETVHRIGSAAKAAGVELLLLNLDFTGTAAADAVHQAAIRDDYRFVDLAARVRADRLEQQVLRSRNAGLAPPQVPLVPLGRVGPPPPEGRGPRMRFRVTGVPAGKPVRIRGGGPLESGFRFDEELLDDSAQGDERAGDGVYSALVEAPTSAMTLRYLFFSDEVAEFEVPADIGESHADRTIRFNRDGDAPIEVFGVRYLLSDDMHPDVEGHRRIAEDILGEIETFASFRRFAGAAPPADGEPPFPPAANRTSGGTGLR